MERTLLNDLLYVITYLAAIFYLIFIVVKKRKKFTRLEIILLIIVSICTVINYVNWFNELTIKMKYSSVQILAIMMMYVLETFYITFILIKIKQEKKLTKLEITTLLILLIFNLSVIYLTF